MAEEKKKGPTKKYRVLQPLRHNLKHYRNGETVDLTATEAKTLLDLKVVEVFPEEK